MIKTFKNNKEENKWNSDKEEELENSNKKGGINSYFESSFGDENENNNDSNNKINQSGSISTVGWFFPFKQKIIGI